jgi:hypothetical protein
MFLAAGESERLSALARKHDTTSNAGPSSMFVTATDQLAAFVLVQRILEEFDHAEKNKE